MNRNIVLALVLTAATIVGCRSAFAPDPVLRLSDAPQPQVPATVRSDAVVRSGPDRGARILQQLSAGTPVTASDATVRGFRRVKTAEGRTGYVEDGALELGAAAARAAPARAATTTQEGTGASAEPEAR
jgi:SH3-like domain-containing protein